LAWQVARHAEIYARSGTDGTPAAKSGCAEDDTASAGHGGERYPCDECVAAEETEWAEE